MFWQSSSAVALALLLVAGCGRPASNSIDNDSSPRPSVPPAHVESPGSATRVAEVSEVPVASTSDWEHVDDASRDGWTIEVWAERAKKTLVELASVLFDDSTTLSAQSLAAWQTQAYRGARLIPVATVEVFRDELFRVERWQPSSTDAEDWLIGTEGFAQTMRGLADVWSDFDNVRYEFKIVRSTLSAENLLETHQLVAISGHTADRSLEQHAKWITQWEMVPDSQQLRLRSARLVDFEQTTSNSGRPLFTDLTSAVFGSEASYQAQLLYGMNHWLERCQDTRYFSPLGNPGIAVADVNGDGLDDLYLCQEANLPNRLYIQQPDGTVRDESADWKVDYLAGSRSALLLDFDNDGDQDLAVAIMGGVVVASNEGDHFQVRDVLTSDDDTTSLTSADYDLDGDLDLYVCVDYPNEHYAAIGEESDGIVVQGGAANRVYHDANNAGKNSLYRNEIRDSEWRFVDATVEVGLDENNRRFTWAAAWEDYDNDGDQDLYVANDFGRNCLYQNEGGRFREIAAEVGVEDSAAGMSADWGDIDRDGRMDIYVANMFSSAGSRITEQPEFKKDVDAKTKQRWRRFAMGNTLFKNDGSAFRDVSSDAAVTLGRWSWSSNFLDVNNDGWPDLAVANGYITTDDTSDL
ncbi:MAG: VCBS repeat-containing protein [Pirellulales bacterium]